MIAVIAGLPGSGKTWFLTTLGAKFLREGRTVYANFDLKIPEGEEWTGQIKRISSLAELKRARDGEVLIDEIPEYLGKNDWDKLDPDVRSKLRQHRKDGLNIWGVAQSYKDIVVDNRRLIQRYITIWRFWRFILASEWQFLLNPTSGIISIIRRKKLWLQWMGVNPLEGYVRIGLREVWQLSAFVPRMYDTTQIITRPEDAPGYKKERR